MARIRKNFFTGTLAAELTIGGASLSCTALADFPIVASPDVAYLVIDPDGVNPEVVKVTVHTASSTTATITRAQDSTSARAWPVGTTVIQSAIASDVVDLATSTTEQGLHVNTESATYGAWHTFGNAANSAGFSGTGTPAEAWGPFVIYQRFGYDNQNANIEKTTQAGFVLANYYGPTVDDSAEAFSVFVGLKDTGTPITQSKPVTAFEAISQVEDGNTVDSSGYMLGVGSRINVLGSATVNTAHGFKASVNSSGGPSFGTIGTYIAFYQPTTAPATTKYGVFVVDPVVSRTSLVVDQDGGDGAFWADLTNTTATVFAKNPDGATSRTTLRVDGIASQTGALQVWRNASHAYNTAFVSSAGAFISTAGIAVQSSAAVNKGGIDNNGVVWTFATAAKSLSAGEVCLYLDPTPGSAKLMIAAKNSSGTAVSGSVSLT